MSEPDGLGKPMWNRLPVGPGSRGGHWHDPEYRNAWHRAWRLANPEYRERERLRSARKRAARKGADPAGIAVPPAFPRPLPQPAGSICACPHCCCDFIIPAVCGFCEEGSHAEP